MTSNPLMERFAAGRLLFDGGMGSMLIAMGLESGSPPEEWNQSRPEAVKGIHRAYLEAGADVAESNTFGATPGRLATHGLVDKVTEFNALGLRLAREATVEQQSRRGRFVAFSMGPTADMLQPVGGADETQVRSEYAEQLRSVSEGDKPDLILIETMIDLREALIALEVTKQTVDLPVAVSLTYSRNPRGFFTVMGDEAAAATRRLEAAGADVIGANCSISSRDMLDLAKVLRDATARPVLCQPNAGNPGVRGGVPVYDQTPDAFAQDAVELFESGVDAVGGCCGTTPDFIRRVREAIGDGPGASNA